MAIHGEKSQAERQETLYDFKRGKMPVLVATDVASRGLDIPTIKTVINFDVAKRLDKQGVRVFILKYRTLPIGVGPNWSGAGCLRGLMRPRPRACCR